MSKFTLNRDLVKFFESLISTRLKHFMYFIADFEIYLHGFQKLLNKQAQKSQFVTQNPTKTIFVQYVLAFECQLKTHEENIKTWALYQAFRAI